MPVRICTSAQRAAAAAATAAATTTIATAAAAAVVVVVVVVVVAAAAAPAAAAAVRRLASTKCTDRPADVGSWVGMTGGCTRRGGALRRRTPHNRTASHRA